MTLRTTGWLGLLALVTVAGWWFLDGPDGATGLDRGLSPAADAGERSGDGERAPSADPAPDPATGIHTRSFHGDDRPAPAVDALTLRFENEVGVAQAGVEVALTVISNSMLSWVGARASGSEPPRQTLMTDVEGEVVLRQLPPTGLQVLGRGQGLVGYEELTVDRVAPGERAIITMKPIRKVSVRVVDQVGQPVAGAPVTSSNASQRGPGYHWTTNPDGVAAFEITPMHGAAYTVKEFRAKVNLATGSVDSERVPWVDGDVTDVIVEVKRGVLVRLSVVDASGEPAVGRKTVRWKAARSGSAALPFISNRSFAVGGWMGRAASEKRRAFEGSETVLAGFKPGSKIKFILEEDGRCDTEETVELLLNGGVAEVVMRRGAAAPVLELPLAHEGGRPVTEGKFRLTVSYPKPGSRSDSGSMMHLSMIEGGGIIELQGGSGGVVRTPDAEGVVRLTADPAKALKLKVDRERVGGQVFGFWSSGNEKKKPLLEVQLPALEAGEVRRLDPLVIPPVPLVVAGHVVDSDGVGVGGALVRLAPIGGPQNPWSEGTFHLTQLKVRTAADGSYSIHSFGQLEGWRVFARLGDSGRSALLPFVLGDTDVTLSLAVVGGFEGVLTSTLTGNKALIRLDAEEGAINPNLRWVYPEMDLSKSCSGAGVFRFEGLAPGRYTARVKLAGYEVLVVKGVVVEGGKANRDPRLDGVVVGGDLVETSVTVRRPDGTPVKGADVSLRVPKGSAKQGPRLQYRTESHGAAPFVLPRGARRDVTVTAKGFLAYNQKDAAFPLDVTLDPGTELTVQLDIAGGGLPDDPKISAWQVRLRPAKEPVAPSLRIRQDVTHEVVEVHGATGPDFEMSINGLRANPRSVNLDRETRRATFKAVPPGKWEVTIRPQVTRKRKSAGGDGMIRRSSKPGKTLDLGPVETRSGVWQQSVRFTVDASVLASLLPQ